MPVVIREGGARKGLAPFFIEDNPEPGFLELLSPRSVLTKKWRLPWLVP